MRSVKDSDILEIVIYSGGRKRRTIKLMDGTVLLVDKPICVERRIVELLLRLRIVNLKKQTSHLKHCFCITRDPAGMRGTEWAKRILTEDGEKK